MIARVDNLELLDDPSGVRIMVLSGEQDLSTAGGLRLALAGAREAGRAVVVESVDRVLHRFDDSRRQSSAGCATARRIGRGFAVVASSSEDEHVPRLLGLSGMRAVFPIYELRSAAVEHAAAGRNAPA